MTTFETSQVPPSDSLLRLRGVLAKVPISRSAWWQGVKDGRFPASVRLGPKTTAWLCSDIDKLIQSLAAKVIGHAN